MRTVRRYYLRDFFKIFGILALGLAMIFSLLDLVDKIDDFMPGKPSVGKLALYALLNLPRYLYYLLPMSLLICSLFVFTQASRNKELVAIRAMGGRLRELCYPFVLLGFLFSAAGFFIGEMVVPDFSERANELRNALSEKEEKPAFREGTIWMRGTDGSFVRIELYVPGKRLAKGVSIFMVHRNRLDTRIEAEEGFWSGGGGAEGVWRLKNATVYDLDKGKVTYNPEMDYPYLESPELFTKRIKKVEEMDIMELHRYIKRLRAAGFKDAKLEVDLNSKISYPLTNFIMMVLGISLSVMGRIGGGLIAAGFGILISFIYWLLYTLALSMGYARVIPPELATWIVPLLSGGAALYLFTRVPE